MLPFSTSFAEARDKFRHFAEAAGGICTCDPHPGDRNLGIDTAWFGSPEASHVLVMMSGTHGQEGFAGSAVQIAWMTANEKLPRHLAVLLIHAVNPYGFARGSRTNENNVDLNRNFVDFPILDRTPHSAFEGLQAAVRIADASESSMRAIHNAMARLRANHGDQAITDLLMAGQYFDPAGLFYGGACAEWSRLTLESIARRLLVARTKVVLIDWHVGLGRFGEPLLLCFNARGSSERALAARWWGAKKLAGATEGFDSGAVPRYQGLVVDGVGESIHPTPSVRAVIEFGTCSNKEIIEALAIDRWIRFVAREGEPGVAEARSVMMDRFFPSDLGWRTGVLAHGLTLARQALDGLACWDRSPE